MKKQSPIGRILEFGEKERGKLALSVILAVVGVVCGMAPLCGGKKRVGRLEAVNLQKRKQKRRRENKNVFAAFFFQFWVLLSDC